MSLEAPPGHGHLLQALAVESDSILPRLERDLGTAPRSRFRMILIPPGAPSDSELRRLDELAPWWAAGFTLPERRMCVIRMELAGRYPYGSLEAVLAHESTHLLIHERGGRPLPLWFEEGVATWEGRRWEFRDVLAYSTALLTSDLPHLAELDSSFHGSAAEAQLAYAGSFAFVARTIHQFGPQVVRELLDAARDRPFDRAWEEVTGTTLASAEAGWRRASLIRYRWIPVLTASSTLWVLITLLSLVVGARRQAAMRRTRERWAREEREEEANEAWWLEPPAESAGAPPGPEVPKSDRDPEG